MSDALGPIAQITIRLIDQLPQILQALGILLAAGLGLYNARKITQVKEQTDGHFTELTRALAASIPASAVAAEVMKSATLAGEAASSERRREEDSAIVKSLDSIDSSAKAIDKNTR